MRLSVLLLLSLLSAPLHAEEQTPVDLATPPASRHHDPEQSLSEQLKRDLPAGEWLELKTAAAPFLALYRPEQMGRPQGAVLLLHDIDTHADEANVVGLLRRRLPEQGWRTLSLQLPLFLASAPPADYLAAIDQGKARLQAAIDWLRQQKVKRLVLIGHGLGATLAADYGREATGRIDGMVLIGMGYRPDYPERLDPLRQLADLKLPYLDLYGSRDRADVITDAARRRSVIRLRQAAEASKPDNQWPPSHRSRYRQVEIGHADHDFSAMADQLHHRVWGWLRQLPPANNLKR